MAKRENVDGNEARWHYCCAQLWKVGAALLDHVTGKVRTYLEMVWTVEGAAVHSPFDLKLSEVAERSRSHLADCCR